MASYQIVKIEDFGNGYCEGSWGWSNGQQRTGSKRGESEQSDLHKSRTISRARANVRRICMALNLDHLLTLTYRENVTNRHRAWHDAVRLIDVLRETYGKYLHVIVPEYQKRGAIHFHIACKGYQNVDFIREEWRKIVGEGNIDVQHIKTKNGAQWKLSKLASYISKYLTKQNVTGLNEQSYHASKNVKRNIKKIIVPFGLSAKEYLLYKIEQIAGQVSFIWESEESKGWYGWACSWT